MTNLPVPTPERPRRSVIGRVTGAVTERVVEAVDPDTVLEHVDVEALIDRIDVNRLLERIDVNALLDRIDPDRLLDRIDPDRLLDRIDVQRLMARVDLDDLLAGLDLNKVLEGVDLESLVRRSGIPDIVAESTGALAGSALDVARRQIVGLDAVSDRVVDSVLRRPPGRRPVSPVLLRESPAVTPLVDAPPALLGGEPEDTAGPAEPTPEVEAEPTPSGTPKRPERRTVSGHYAGPVSRGAAAIIDIGVILGGFTVLWSGAAFLLDTLFGWDLGNADRGSLIGVISLVTWGFFYLFLAHAVVGRTIGKGILGLTVVNADGSPISARGALVRTLALPLSTLLFGAGLIMVVVQRENRALHDVIGRTAVVYDWGDRSAELPGPLADFLSRRQAD